MNVNWSLDVLKSFTMARKKFTSITQDSKGRARKNTRRGALKDLTGRASARNQRREREDCLLKNGNCLQNKLPDMKCLEE